MISQHCLISLRCYRPVEKKHISKSNPTFYVISNLTYLLSLLNLTASNIMPLVMSLCALDDANNLAQAHLATLACSAPSPSKHYLKITDTSTNEIAAYAIWISIPPIAPPPPPPPQRCHKLDDHDPWLLSTSQLVTSNNSNDGNKKKKQQKSGLCIGLRERLWSSCLYRGARTAATLRRLGFKVKGVDRRCRERVKKSARMSVGGKLRWASGDVKELRLGGAVVEKAEEEQASCL